MKSKNHEEVKKAEDIISRMPDDVLIHILSRLETVDAVRTCILSIYNLHLRFHWSRSENDILFINQVLALLQSENIQSFDLRVCCAQTIQIDEHIQQSMLLSTMFLSSNQWI